MARSRKKVNRRSVLTLLVLVSIVGLLLPRSLTGRLINLVQVLTPFQDVTARSLNAADDALGSDGSGLSPAEADALRRRNAALQHQVASLAGRLQQLEAEHRTLAGIRRRGLAGGRLIPARAVAADALPWRQSRLLTAGTLSGVRSDAAVTSDYFSITPDAPDALRDGMSVLAGEVLVGFIEQVGTHTARVRLLTDRQSSLEVMIARLEDDRYLPLDARFRLVGTGKRMLEIPDIDHRYIEEGAIREGDVVLSLATDPRLPAALTVGVVKAIQQDRDNSLLYRLEVEPPLAPDAIRHVFVVDPGQG